MSNEANIIESKYPKRFSADWWHVYIFHIAIKCIKRSIWLCIHRLPVFFIKKWQLLELRPLLHQSYINVPLYRKLLDEVSMRPEEIKSYSDLIRLPITSKKIFRQHPPEEFINNSFPKWSYIWTETSGSTGEPFKFPINRAFWFLKKYYCGTPSCAWYKMKNESPNADPYVDRFLLWRGFSFRTISNNFRFADIRVVNRPRGGHFLHIPVSDIRENPDSIVEKLLEFRPDVLSGRATTMLELSRIMQKYGVPKKFRIPFITSVGEMMNASQRRYLENFFDCEVYERYGLEELGDIAIECRIHEGMHIHEESNLVEILDENSRQPPRGASGRIVITNLCNSSVPFIRYDTGDRGKILPGSCPCGISARRLKIDGRIGAFLELDGKRYQFPEFALIINDFSDFILRSQIAKINKNSVEFRFIPSRPVSNKEFNAVKSSFRDRLGITPLIKIVEEIPFNKSGKTQFLIDES